MTNRNLVERYLMNTAALVVIVAGMRAARAILVPCLLAAFVAIVLTPVLIWLQQRRVSTGMALLLIMTAITSVVFSVMVLVGDSFTNFARRLPDYQSKLMDYSDRAGDWVRGYGIHVPEFGWARGEPDLVDRDPTSSPSGSETANRLETEGDFLDPAEPDFATETPFDLKGIGTFVRQILTSLGSILGNALVVLIAIVFMLLEAAHLPSKMQAGFGSAAASLQRLEEIIRNVRRYMAIKTATSLLTGLLVLLLLTFFRIDYATLWGLLAFLCNFVPNIGSILASIPAIVVALVQHGPSTSLGVMVGYMAINFLVSYGVEPRFMGVGLGLSTLVILLSLFFWGWVLGPVGMLLSAPLTMIVKIVSENFEETRPIAILLGSKLRHSA